MVELLVAAYDDDDIPFASASLVSIDAELSDDTIVTAGEAIASSPTSSVTNSAYLPTREYSIPDDQSSSGFDRHLSDSESNSGDDRYGPPPGEVRDSQRTVGAGAAGAILGLLVGGPVFSLVLGFGTVYYTKQEGATGDLARALGEVALVARDKWKEVDSKHHIVDQSRQAANEAIHRIQEADRRHHARAHLYKFVSFCWKSTLQFVDRHRVVERGCDKLKVLAEHVAETIQAQHNRVRNCPHHQHHHHHHQS